MKSTSKILKYRETHTLAETGKKFRLTSERVRQIQHLKDRKRCEKHQRFYYNTCSHCLGESYRLYLNNLKLSQVLVEVKKEAKNRKRDYLSHWRRVYLIERLYAAGYSFTQISEFLKRDYSTIIHSFKKLNYD